MSSAGLTGAVHSLILSVQHFLCQPLSQAFIKLFYHGLSPTDNTGSLRLDGKGAIPEMCVFSFKQGVLPGHKFILI